VFVDIPKIEVVLTYKEYIFLYGVLDDTIHSLDAFTPPQESQNLLLPAPAEATVATTPVLDQHAPGSESVGEKRKWSVGKRERNMEIFSREGDYKFSGRGIFYDFTKL
jgi:hypothetical protein